MYIISEWGKTRGEEWAVQRARVSPERNPSSNTNLDKQFFYYFFILAGLFASFNQV